MCVFFSLSENDTAARHSKCRNWNWCCSSRWIQSGDADSEQGPREAGSMHSHELGKKIQRDKSAKT